MGTWYNRSFDWFETSPEAWARRRAAGRGRHLRATFLGSLLSGPLVLAFVAAMLAGWRLRALASREALTFIAGGTAVFAALHVALEAWEWGRLERKYGAGTPGPAGGRRDPAT